jgi:hypothetical protein
MRVLLCIISFIAISCAGIYPYCGQAFVTWEWKVSHETPSLYFDIQREYEYKIWRIDYNEMTDVCTIFPAWIKVNDPGK